jgi:hypothetical protein
VDVAVHLEEHFWATVKDPHRNGLAQWLEIVSGNDTVAIFGSREQLEVLEQQLTEYRGRWQPQHEPEGGDAMKGRRPDWIASTVVEGEQKSRWREIGVAFDAENGETITLLLDALPVSGKLVLTRPKKQASDTGSP